MQVLPTKNIQNLQLFPNDFGQTNPVPISGNHPSLQGELTKFSSTPKPKGFHQAPRFFPTKPRDVLRSQHLRSQGLVLVNFIFGRHGCWTKNRGMVNPPKWMVKIVENPYEQMDNLGGTIIFVNTHMGKVAELEKQPVNRFTGKLFREGFWNFKLQFAGWWWIGRSGICMAGH